MIRTQVGGDGDRTLVVERSSDNDGVLVILAEPGSTTVIRLSLWEADRVANAIHYVRHGF